MSRYYDRAGHPITSEQWSEYLSNPDIKCVAQTTLPNGYWISTVWLGLDHQFGNGSPLIFETMVFPHDGKDVSDWGDLDSDRYSTETDALAGHERIVSEWAAKPAKVERRES